MKRILLDENVPIGTVRLLSGYDVRHVHEQGWAGISNGELIRRAERHAFDVLVTADQNLAYQQNMRTRRVALLILSSNNWVAIRANVERIANALNTLRDGDFETVPLGGSRSR